MAQPRRVPFPGRSRRGKGDQTPADPGPPPLRTVPPGTTADEVPPLPKATRGWLLALVVSLVVWGAVLAIILWLI